MNQREAIAYEESGHAVGFTDRGFKVHHASIDGGDCEAQGLERFRNESALARANVIALLCGPIALAKFTGNALSLPSGSHDHDEIVKNLAIINHPEACHRCLEFSREIIRENWSSVEIIAAVLMERGKIFGDEVEQIVEAETQKRRLANHNPLRPIF